MVSLKNIQIRSFRSFKDPVQIDFPKNGLILVDGFNKDTGGSSGCHRKGEKVLMFDGSFKAVENIVIGDKLMGPDSKSRIVEELKRGQDTMYKITPRKGECLYVNGNHILVYEYRSQNANGKKYRSVKQETIKDYIKRLPVQKNGFVHNHALIRTGVEFSKKTVLIDPYFLGIWLGDGDSHQITITTIDKEIVEELEKFAKMNKQCLICNKPKNRVPFYSIVLGRNNRKKNPLRTKFKKYNLFYNKHVPDIYKTNSKNIRLQILAGLLDSDGHLTNKCFDFINKSKQLAEDVLYLARSVGLAAYIKKCKKRCANNDKWGTYFRVSISGHTDIIPTKILRKKAGKRKQIKNVLHSGFMVEKVSDKEEYYGFILNKDHLYLDDSFNVLHNSGKTSIIEAVAYALGYSSIPATELKCRYSDKPLEVILLLSTDEGDAEICRGPKSYIKYLDKKVEITGAKNILGEVQKIMGLPTDLIEALTYRPQRTLGRFISMTDSEKKEFLTNCLPELEEIEKTAEDARQKLTSKKTEIENINSAMLMSVEEKQRLKNIKIEAPPPIDSFIPQLEAEQQKKEKLQLDLKITRDVLEVATRNYEEEKTKLSNSFSTVLQIKKEKLAKELSLYEKEIQTNKEAEALIAKDIELTVSNNQSAINVLMGQIQEKKSKVVKIKQITDKKPSLEQQAEELKRTLVELEKNNCPTCLRQWEEARAKIQTAQDGLASTEKLIHAATLLEDKAVIVEKEIIELEAQQNNISMDIPEDLKIKLVDAKKRLSDLEYKYLQVKADLNSLDSNMQASLDKDLMEKKQAVVSVQASADTLLFNLALSEKEISNINTQIEMSKDQIKAYEDNRQKIVQTIEDVTKKIEAKQVDLARIKTEHALELSIYEALGRRGYLGSIFDEILDEISEEVTEVLSKIPNVNSVSLRFVSESEMKSGKTKRAITPLVTKDGVEAPLRTLSGGQQASVELAVDLAIGNVIMRRTGRTPGWIVLDEAFDGMDLPTKEICMELLKTYSLDRLILVIDHSTEVKEGFDKNIRVVMENGLSKIA